MNPLLKLVPRVEEVECDLAYAEHLNDKAAVEVLGLLLQAANRKANIEAAGRKTSPKPSSR